MTQKLPYNFPFEPKGEARVGNRTKERKGQEEINFGLKGCARGNTC